jgi:starch phosphorylase
VTVGEEVSITASVDLGPLTPGDVSVEAYYGKSHNGQIISPQVAPLELQTGAGTTGFVVFSGKIPAAESGSYGLSVRVLPAHPNLTQAHELRLITWAR